MGGSGKFDLQINLWTWKLEELGSVSSYSLFCYFQHFISVQKSKIKILELMNIDEL